MNATFIGFATAQDAQAHHATQGGWMFINADGSAVWYDAAKFTPSAIMTHCTTRGQNGTVTCRRDLS